MLFLQKNQLFIPMLPLVFGGKIRKMRVDLLRMSKILMDFLKFFEKSVEFFASNTDWNIIMYKLY